MRELEVTLSKSKSNKEIMVNQVHDLQEAILSEKREHEEYRQATEQKLDDMTFEIRRQHE